MDSSATVENAQQKSVKCAKVFQLFRAAPGAYELSISMTPKYKKKKRTRTNSEIEV